MNSRGVRWIASLLLLAVGVARGVGGVVLWRGGSATVGLDARASSPVHAMAIELIIVAALCIGGAVLTLSRSRSAWWVSVAGLAAFVVGGLINGTLLYGDPRVTGVAANVAYASLTLAVLWRALRKR